MGLFEGGRNDFHIGTQRLLTVQINCMQCFTKSVCTVNILRNNVFVPCFFSFFFGVKLRLIQTQGVSFCKIL